jgi:hypothetical protein
MASSIIYLHVIFLNQYPTLFVSRIIPFCTSTIIRKCAENEKNINKDKLKHWLASVIDIIIIEIVNHINAAYCMFNTNYTNECYVANE